MCRLALEAQTFYQAELERNPILHNEETVFAVVLVRILVFWHNDS